MWFELENHKNEHLYILNRFGLEGEWGLEKKKHSNVLFVVEKDEIAFNLYFTDQISFGTVAISDNKTDLLDELDSLGPDLLKEDFSDDQFVQRIMRIKNKDKEIGKVLLDQKKSTGIGSGIGTYLASEILYYAMISPHKKLSDILNNQNLAYQLAYAIKYIIKLAFLTENTGYMEHMGTENKIFIEKKRKQIHDHETSKFDYHKDVKTGNHVFHFKIYRQKMDPNKNPVSRYNVSSGRSLFWVPAAQT